MKKLIAFIDKKLSYILILPAIIFILLFSIIPIFQSLKYAFYDFQLNDQGKSGLYTGLNYNLALYSETFDYIKYYLDLEESVVQKTESLKQIDFIRDELKTYESYINENIATNSLSPIVELDEKQSLYVVDMKDKILLELETLYSYGDSYYSKEDMMAVASELDTSIITSNFIAFNNFKKVVTDGRVRFTMGITLIFTFISVFFELILGLILALIALACDPVQSILWFAFKIFSLTGGATLGVFLLGLLTKRCANRGNIPAMIAGTVCTGTLLVLTHLGVIDLAWTWLIVIGTAVTFVLGYLLGSSKPTPHVVESRDCGAL